MNLTGRVSATAPSYDATGERPLSLDTSGALRVTSGATAGTALPAGTDRSGSIAAGGTAQQLAPANTSRQALTGQNTSAGNLGINEIGGTAAIGSAGTYTIAAGQSFSVATNRAISIVGATTGQTFTATEI